MPSPTAQSTHNGLPILGVARHALMTDLIIHGEGPIWIEEPRLSGYFGQVDIYRGNVHFCDAGQPYSHGVLFSLRRLGSGEVLGFKGAGPLNNGTHSPIFIGAALPHREGFILAAENSLYLFNRDAGQITGTLPIETDLPGNRFNDAKTSPEGIVFVGSMNRKPGENPPSGNFYSVDKGGNVLKLLENVGISNGLVFSPDGKLLYYIDTFSGGIDVINRVDAGPDLERDTEGKVIRRKLVQFDTNKLGHPDGMCGAITESGALHLFVAMWGGNSVLRVDATSGEIIGVYKVPVAHTSSCCFGGPAMDTLYITTSTEGRSPEGLKLDDHAGSSFSIKINGVQGLPTYISDIALPRS